LNGLGLGRGDYALSPVADLTVDVSVILGGTLGDGINELVETVLALVDEILDSLLGIDIVTKPKTSSPTPTHPGHGDGIVVDIDLSGIVLGATLSDAVDLVNEVLEAVSGVLERLLGLDVDIVINVDGGHDCGCSRSRKVSAKN